jgi:gamma-glutamylputrescine oxidase
LEAQPSARVLVIESQCIGFGASTRNSGMLTPGIGQDLGKLVRQYGADKARQMYLTSLQAVSYVGQLCDRGELEFGLRKTGQLVIARGRAGRERLSRQAQLMHQLNLPCQELDDAQLLSRLNISLPKSGVGPAALQFPIAGTLDPGQLVRGLADAVIRRGGRILENTRVMNFHQNGVQLDKDLAIRAKKVVIATNGYDLALSRQQGRLLPLHLRMILTRRLSTSEMDQLRWTHREGVIDSRRVFNYFRLTDDNRLMLGGSLPVYQWGGDVKAPAVDQSDLRQLQADIQYFFPSLANIEVDGTWSGVIAYSRDTLPVVGTLPGYPNVIHVGGWCGHGVALSVYSGRWVAALVQAESPTGAEFEQPWFRETAPRVPTEIARWCGVGLGGRATQWLDLVF